MVESPSLVLSAESARQWHAEGPLAGRALEVARGIAGRLVGRRDRRGPVSSPDRAGARRACRTRRGHPVEPGGDPGPLRRLGTPRTVDRGTLGPDRSRSAFRDRSARVRPRRPDRRRRPARSRVSTSPPGAGRVSGRLGGARHSTPGSPGLHGSDELRAFAELPPIADRVTDRLCRLVLLGLLPAVQERDLESFGVALTELQQQVGQCFATAQGGIYARPELEAIVADLRAPGAARGRAEFLGPDALRLQQPAAGRAPEDPRTDPNPLRSSRRRPLLDVGESGGEPLESDRLTQQHEASLQRRCSPRSTPSTGPVNIRDRLRERARFSCLPDRNGRERPTKKRKSANKKRSILRHLKPDRIRRRVWKSEPNNDETTPSRIFRDMLDMNCTNFTLQSRTTRNAVVSSSGDKELFRLSFLRFGSAGVW